MTNVFEYIYGYDPNGAIALCNQYGINVSSDDDVINGLQVITVDGGQQGFKDVLNLHPEKDVIIENFAPAPAYKNCTGGGNCNGGGCRKCELSDILIKTNQASGGSSAMQPQNYPSQNNNVSGAIMQTNTLIVIATISLIVVGFYIHSANAK